MEIKEYKIEIVGAVPLILDKMDRGMVLEQEEVPKDKRTDWEEKNWLRKAYTRKIGEEEKVYIPEENIHRMLQDAGYKYKISPPKSIGRTWSNYIKSCIIIKDVTDLKYGQVVPYAKYVNGNPSSKTKSSKVYKIRPMFYDWSIIFTIQDFGGYMKKDIIAGLIKTGGIFCSIGNYRPQYGRFSVKNITENIIG
jgi:hypothetical protein